MALPLGLQSVDDERRLLKWVFGVGIALITFFLAVTNGTGAWVATKSWAFTGLAIGAEIALVAAFSLIVLGETRWRQVVGAIVFVGLAWFCVENGKAAVKHWMSDVFVGSPEELRAQADLMNAQAGKLDALPEDTKTEAAATRADDREELAALRVELDLMASSTRIREAQTRLKALGLYTGPIDGIRADLTEEAMLARGEAVSARIAILQAKLDEGGAQVGALAALAPAQTARLEAIRLTDQAKEVTERELWAQILLLVAEAARSFGVWAFLMAGTRESARFGRRAGDWDENHTTQNNVGDLRGPEPAPAPEPVIRDPIIEAPAIGDPIIEDAAVNAAIDTAVNDDEPAPSKPQVGDPWKGGISAGMNHEINNMDDSLPIDAKGIAA
jgi:hypothetical protein